MDKIRLTLSSIALLVYCYDEPSISGVPLNNKEWRMIERIIKYKGYRGPSILLNMSFDDLCGLLEIDEAIALKMTERSKQVNALIEYLYKIENKSIYITTKYEKDYPKQLLDRNKKRAPLYLHYCGDLSSICEGISIVGMQKVDDKDKGYIKRLTDKVIEEEKMLVSNNTKGTDKVAFKHALNHGGKVALFVCENMEMLIEKYKRQIRNKQLIILNAYSLSKSFNVTNAIDTNSYICGLSKYQLIIKCNINKGLTGFTCLQNLKHDWTDMMIVRDGSVYNERIYEMGVTPINIKDILSEYTFDMIYNNNVIDSNDSIVEVDQMSIFDFIEVEDEK